MWPSECAELKHIENLLVCGICYEYMDTSVITSCSHNYCSLCIRKYLHYKAQCPTCFSETFEKDLRKNKVLDEIILQFSHVKKKLESCLEGQVTVRNYKDDNGYGTPKSVKHRNDSPSNKQTNRVLDESIIVQNSSPPCSTKTTPKTVNSPSTSGQPNIAQFFTPKSRKEVTDTKTVKDVICPVCKVSVSETNINRHLDDCLKRQGVKEQIKVEEPKRKPLPKLVFSLMKDGVVRKKLKELGLSSQGDRKALESRLQRYTILYNAECDKLNPRPVADLIKLCEEEENLEKRVNKASSSVNKLHINRNSEQNVIDKERKKYLEAHKNSFDNLISRMKNVNTPNKSRVRRSLLNNSLNCEMDVPEKRLAVDLNEDSESNDFQLINNNDVDIEASDSDTSCPLQMYSSSDPMGIVNVQLSSSCEDNTSPKTTPKRSGEMARIQLGTSNETTIQDELRIDNRCSFSDVANCELATGFGSPIRRTALQHKLAMKETISTESNYKLQVDAENSGAIKLERMDEECDERTHVQEDFIHDFSSNDSIDTKPTNENSGCTLDGFLSTTGTNFCNIEKENINSPSKDSTNRGLRKRNRDSVQMNRTPSKLVTEMKKSSRLSHDKTAETNHQDHVLGILHETENGTVRKMPTKRRKQDTEATKEDSEKSPILRKSSRARLRTRTLLK